MDSFYNDFMTSLDLKFWLSGLSMKGQKPLIKMIFICVLKMNQSQHEGK